MFISEGGQKKDWVKKRKWSAVVVFLIFTSGCYTVEVDSLEDWCDHITGVDLLKRAPFWAVLPGVKFDSDAIRDDYVRVLNDAAMSSVGGRAVRMVWRDSLSLHIENIANLVEIEHDSIITEWEEGIGRAKSFETKDEMDMCLFGGIFSLFDSVIIHSAGHDGLRFTDEWTTIILTERRALLEDPI